MCQLSPSFLLQNAVLIYITPERRRIFTEIGENLERN
jgi:hypothetical protein